jgi:hypothetical protein
LLCPHNQWCASIQPWLWTEHCDSELIPRAYVTGVVHSRLGWDYDLMSCENSSTYLELEERLHFETLIADLSSKFVNLPAEDVDKEILEAQRGICECLGLDVAGLWQWSDKEGGSFLLSHLFSTDEGLRRPERASATEYFPWCQLQMLAGRTVVLSSMEEFPAEAAVDRETSRHFGIKSSLMIPLSTGGSRPLGHWPSTPHVWNASGLQDW